MLERPPFIPEEISPEVAPEVDPKNEVRRKFGSVLESREEQELELAKFEKHWPVFRMANTLPRV